MSLTQLAEKADLQKKLTELSDEYRRKFNSELHEVLAKIAVEWETYFTQFNFKVTRSGKRIIAEHESIEFALTVPSAEDEFIGYISRMHLGVKRTGLVQKNFDWEIRLAKVTDKASYEPSISISDAPKPISTEEKIEEYKSEIEVKKAEIDNFSFPNFIFILYRNERSYEFIEEGQFSSVIEVIDRVAKNYL